MSTDTDKLTARMADSSNPVTLPRELNLGCGMKRRDNCLNVDRIERVRPDLLWDLDRHPYPLPESYFQRIYVGDVIEHLQDVSNFMLESHRLLEAGGLLEITTPHFSCANSYTDPTHRHHLGYFSLDYFTSSHDFNFYSTARFEIVERQIVFHYTFANRIVRSLANRYPAEYERRYAWIFPAWFMIFRLRAIK